MSKRVAVLFLLVAFLGCQQKAGRLSTEQAIDRLKSIDERNRKPAADLLAAMGEQIVPRLLQEMSSPHTQVRFEVAHLLGRIRDPRAVAALIAALDDQSANVAQTAAWSLGSLRAPEAVPALLGYTHDISAGVRKQATWALGACHSDTLDPALADSAYREVLRSVDDPEPEVRVSALLALREFGLRGAVNRVIDLACDPSPDVRYIVVQLLEQVLSGGYDRSIGKLPPETSERVVPALVALLADSEHQSIRTHAIRALGRSRDPRAQEPLSHYRDAGTAEDREEATRALGWLASGGQ